MSTVTEKAKEFLNNGKKVIGTIEKEVSHDLHKIAGVTVEGAKVAVAVGVAGMEYVGRDAAELKMILTDDEYRGRLNPFEEGTKANYMNAKAYLKSKVGLIENVPIVGQVVISAGKNLDKKISEKFGIDEHQASAATALEDKINSFKVAISNVPEKLAERRARAATNVASAPSGPKA